MSVCLCVCVSVSFGGGIKLRNELQATGNNLQLKECGAKPRSISSQRTAIWLSLPILVSLLTIPWRRGDVDCKQTKLRRVQCPAMNECSSLHDVHCKVLVPHAFAVERRGVRLWRHQCLGPLLPSGIPKHWPAGTTRCLDNSATKPVSSTAALLL